MLRMKERFASINFTSLFFEMLIVFVGVYLAFLLSGYQETKKVEREGARVVALLQVGLEYYEKLFEGFALRHENVNAAFRSQLENNEIPEYWQGGFYAAPQYPIDVINFVLTKESYKVFALDVYLPLTSFANAMQRVMYVEEKLVSIAEQYEPLPAKSNPEYDRVFAQQRVLAARYLRYLDMRKSISEELVVKIRALSSDIEELNLESP